MSTTTEEYRSLIERLNKEGGSHPRKLNPAAIPSDDEPEEVWKEFYRLLDQLIRDTDSAEKLRAK